MNYKIRQGTARSLLDPSLQGKPLWLRVGDNLLEVKVIDDHFGDINAVTVKFYADAVVEEKVFNETDPVEFATAF